MGKVKAWVMDMEEDAIDMAVEEWTDKHGESLIEVYHEARREHLHKGKKIEEAFDAWWDSNEAGLLPDPENLDWLINIEIDSPMWWAWQGWKAASERLEQGGDHE